MQCPECGTYEDIILLPHPDDNRIMVFRCISCDCLWNERTISEVTHHGMEYEHKLRKEEEKKYKQVLYKLQDIEG